MSDAAVAPEPRITLKQRKFAKAYAATGNGTQAAIKAGYSPHTAKQIAAENLTKPVVNLLLQQALAEEERKAELEEQRNTFTRERVAMMLCEDREFARTLEHPTAAITATMGIAKVYGLVDKPEPVQNTTTIVAGAGHTTVLVERQILEIFSSDEGHGETIEQS